MDYAGKIFADETVTLDGNTFQGCRFEKAVLRYNGGATKLTGCSINACVFALGGDLKRGIEALGQLLGKDAALELLARVIEPARMH